MIRDLEKMFFVVILLTRVSSSTEVKDTRSLASSLDLQCPSCDRIHCTPRRPSQLRCKGGIVRGVCDCCPVCAKTREEACGGHWNYLGRCDIGLACDPNKNQVMDDFTLDEGRHVTEIRRWMPEGRCRKVQELNDGPQLLQPVKCYPACSHQFCSRNPKEICSAADVADRKQSCQGDCQHTSCSACRFMKPEIECVRCIKDDWECLKKFGRCIRKTHCHRNDFPCKLNKDEDGYKFRCVVPQCPSN